MASPFLRRIVAGLVAGVATGVFVGEEAAILQTVADGFVKLLQMAVLPYVTFSIIANLGALNIGILRRLGARTAMILPALWALALAMAFLMPLAFPPAQSGSFFSTALLDEPSRVSFVDLYIPANPFFALANGIVPAVVLFSAVVGVALIGLPQKRVLLDVLEAASETLSRVMGFVVRLTPYGVFAIAASTAGTMRLDQVRRLEIYFVAYAAFALLLALWCLPRLVSALTPIPAREIFRATREPVLTAAVAGDLFVVLPVLIGACKRLLVRHIADVPQASALPDVIVPISFNFPHSGKLLSVSFVLFAGWFSDASIPGADYARLAVTAVVTMFGSVNTAVPFLLDAFRVPADTFELFVASSVLNSRFGALVAAMHTVAMALLGSCAVAGALRWRSAALVRYAAATAVLAAAVVGGTRLFAELVIGGPPTSADTLATMSIEPHGESVIISGHSDPSASPPPAGGRLQTIAARRTLRVGYLSDGLPFAFFNARGELVGFDIALMHRLAHELGVALEFVPITRDALDGPAGPELLYRAQCDIIVGGLAVTPTRAGTMHLSSTYLSETFAFIVRDGDRRRFDSWDRVREAGPITIAGTNVRYYMERLRTLLPHARFRVVEKMDDLFRLPSGSADAFALPAERGSAWTLRHPEYAVVVPSPGRIGVPLAFALPRGETELATFVNTWLALKRSDGTLDELYEYWILGRDRARPAPRWSILRNVLGWPPLATPADPVSPDPAS